LKATLEKRDGQIKKLGNADKENRNSRHFGNPVRTHFLSFLSSCIDLEDSEPESDRRVEQLDFDHRRGFVGFCEEGIDLVSLGDIDLDLTSILLCR
jgi:hypothetical protein